jgi:hypothetical protein
MREAEELLATVRDDPPARLALAARFYDRPGIEPYRRAEVAFMRWQIRRGVLAPVERGGSRWWRSVNEALLRDAWTASHRLDLGLGEAGHPPVDRWIHFLAEPSPRTWYRAHNTSIVAGYLTHRDLIEHERPVERFFMDVALLRVLYADCLLSDARLALGRLAPVGRLLGDPRRRGTGMFLSMHNILPAKYPLPETDLVEILEAENMLGRLFDYGVILPRARRLYEHAARDLDQPGLLTLIDDDFPAYAWPAAEAYAWQSRRPRSTGLIARITG